MKRLFTTKTTIILLVLILIMVPGTAMAYDIQDGASNIKELLVTIVGCAILGASVVCFFKREIVQSVLLGIVGAVLVFVTQTTQLKSIGEALVNFIMGG